MMTDNTSNAIAFTEDTALTLLLSSDKFPVDFDDAWRWIGWTNKRNGKDTLVNNFVEGVDYSRSGSKSPTGGRPSELIQLTVECLKMLGMMAGTEKGKEIRAYFLQCEKVAKQEESPSQPQPAPQVLPDINSSLHLLNSLLDPLADVGVDMRLIQSAKISAIAVQHPEYQQMLAATKENLVLLTPDDDRRYTPTRLGEMYAEKHGLEKPVSPRAVNKALEAAGYQIAEYHTNSKNKQVLEWKITAEGEEFGKIFLEVAQGCNKTLSVIRWLPAVLDAIAIFQ